ncbi:probable GPI-anchored adhesin-like protein PGA55 [Nicotiana tomentosiformis]|uniref:probable GPI-anchored adhesin-like protein PGA55 n=1 Tax=Nicotiana tomentosiformis TaxID=4098 RepID=UPI00051B958E|nr:uncharacterized protein LOC104104809 [Nicotiana tomentosiformis]
MKEAFPSRGEREVASALLLLSSITPSPLPKSNNAAEISHKVALSNSTSASNSKSKSSDSSIVTAVDGSFTEDKSQSRRTKMIATFREIIMKLKVVRQRRSKSFCISNCRKISSSKSEVSTSLTKFCRSTKVSASDSDASKITASSSSCVSIDSVSYGISTSRDRMGRGKRDRLLANEFKPNIAPAYIRRRAEAILRVLSHESASEVRIRQLIGNSPDTSKALRMLLKQGKVKRSGEGGRSDPYIYVAISPRNFSGLVMVTKPSPLVCNLLSFSFTFAADNKQSRQL